MSEEPKTTAPAAGQPAAPQDEDFLFKIQVAATEFFLKNGRYFIYIVGAVVLVAFAYGGFTSLRDSRREAQFGAIAEIDYRMPKPDPMAAYGLAPRDDASDATRMSNLEEGARRYEAAAAASSGSAAAYAWLHAADAWDRAGKSDARLLALQQASSVGAPALAGFAADSAYAGALLDAGRTDEALTVYRTMAGKYTDIYGAQSLASLARAQFDAHKAEDAKTTVAELKTRFPSHQTLVADVELMLATPSGS